MSVSIILYHSADNHLIALDLLLALWMHIWWNLSLVQRMCPGVAQVVREGSPSTCHYWCTPMEMPDKTPEWEQYHIQIPEQQCQTSWWFLQIKQCLRYKWSLLPHIFIHEIVHVCEQTLPELHHCQRIHIWIYIWVTHRPRTGEQLRPFAILKQREKGLPSSLQMLPNPKDDMCCIRRAGTS